MRPSGLFVRLRKLPFGATLLAVALGCSSGGKGPMEPIFNRWRDAFVDGNFEYVYEHMSASMRSRWLFDIFIPTPTANGPKYRPIAERALKRLPGGLKTDFNTWLEFNRRSQGPELRVSPLPAPVMSSDWLKSVCSENFAETQPILKHQFAGYEFRSAGVDGDSATISVLNINRRAELFEAVKEQSDWRFNYHMSAPTK